MHRRRGRNRNLGNDIGNYLVDPAFPVYAYVIAVLGYGYGAHQFPVAPAGYIYVVWPSVEGLSRQLEKYGITVFSILPLLNTAGAEPRKRIIEISYV